MKFSKLPISLAVVGSFVSGLAFADDPIIKVPLVMVKASEVFVPQGFDDNDEAVAVVDGYLPDSCYRLAHTEAKFDQATKSFKVIQWARKFDGVCLDLKVPFFTEARLGMVPMGDYQVRAFGAAVQNLGIKEAANSGPDDFLYAPVDAVRVDHEEVEGEFTATLQGRFTNTCMKIDDVKVIGDARSLVVLPVMKMTGQDNCRDQEVPFSWKVDLPSNLPAGRHLLHVRSLNGKSINQVFSIAD